MRSSHPVSVAEALMTREASVAGVLERLIRETATSMDAALYRFNNPRLAKVLEEAARRGVKVRLVVDYVKYKGDQVTRKLLARHHLPFRTLSGRRPGSKMHHKFIILDGHIVLTGSYNWTLESEEENYDNLAVLGEGAAVEIYQREFDALWQEGEDRGNKVQRQRRLRSSPAPAANLLRGGRGGDVGARS